MYQYDNNGNLVQVVPQQTMPASLDSLIEQFNQLTAEQNTITAKLANLTIAIQNISALPNIPSTDSTKIQALSSPVQATPVSPAQPALQ